MQYFLHFNDKLVIHIAPTERFSIQYRKTKTKVIIPTNHKKRKQDKRTNQKSKQIHITGAKRGITRPSESHGWF